MRFRTILVGAVLTVVGLLALLNWSEVSRPTTLNVLVAQVDAPLGIVLLMVIGFLTLVYAGGLVKLQVAALLEGRQLAKDLENARKLADQAEASRVRGIQEFLNREIMEIEVKLDMVLDAVKKESGTTNILPR